MEIRYHIKEKKENTKKELSGKKMSGFLSIRNTYVPTLSYALGDRERCQLIHINIKSPPSSGSQKAKSPERHQICNSSITPGSHGVTPPVQERDPGQRPLGLSCSAAPCRTGVGRP